MSNEGRWGATPLKVTEVLDVPGKWADAQTGVTVDWSGVTAVLICLDPKCNEAFGPVLSLNEISAACAQHRDLAHPIFNAKGARTTPIPPEAKLRAQGIQVTCGDCGKTTKTNRGRCAGCNYEAQVRNAVELGYLPSGATAADLEAWKKAERQAALENAQSLYEAYSAYKGKLTWPEWFEKTQSAPKPKRGSAIGREAKPITHGTVSGYKYHECRCDLCRQAVTTYEREKRALTRKPVPEKRTTVIVVPPGVPGVPREYSAPVPLPGKLRHGTWNAYNKARCRCQPCSDEAARYRKASREARLAK